MAPKLLLHFFFDSPSIIVLVTCSDVLTFRRSRNAYMIHVYIPSTSRKNPLGFFSKICMAFCVISANDGSPAVSGWISYSICESENKPKTYDDNENGK